MVSTCLQLNKRVEALEYVGRAKSRALLDLLSNSPIDVNQLVEEEDSSGLTRGIKELISREADLRAQIAHLERQFFHGHDPDYSNPGSANDAEHDSDGDSSGSSAARLRGSAAPQEDTRKLYLEWREVLNQLRRRHPNYANLVSATTLNYSEIQALWQTNKLNADTCVIEFFFPQDYLLVACVQKENGDAKAGLTTHVVMDPQSLELIREDIATFFEMSSTEGWEVPVSLCRRLYQSLLGPVLEKLDPGIERLLLIPHGSLYHLPFSALHDQNGYVCERFAVSYVPTVSLIPILASAQNRKSETDEVSGDARYLVTAISDYSATREGGMVFSSRLRSSAGLEDLAYTMEEANSILSLGQSSSVRSAASTLLTNEEVKRSLPEMFGDFDVVHFAGHAIFNHDEPMASGLVLSDGSILSAASILEGNALRTERGRLLVLSACQTGVNVVTEGGEILGLARALMYAGMPNLVLSLWEVADRSTAELMQDFHTCWQSGKISVAQALRQAQLKAIAAKQPVHAWAPFIHFGIE